MSSISMIAHVLEDRVRLAHSHCVLRQTSLPVETLGRCVQVPVRVNSESDVALKHTTWDPIEMELPKQIVVLGRRTPLEDLNESTPLVACMCRALLTLPVELHPKCLPPFLIQRRPRFPSRVTNPQKNTRKASVIGCGVLDCHQIHCNDMAEIQGVRPALGSLNFELLFSCVLGIQIPFSLGIPVLNGRGPKLANFDPLLVHLCPLV